MNNFYYDYSYPNINGYMANIPVMPICPILARAYVPYQYYKMSYEPSEAIDKGTLFPELYRPYIKDVKTKETENIKEE